MNALLPLFILALGSNSLPANHCPGAVEVFSCNFTEAQDQDYDGWPDGWTRGRGPGLPQYVRVQLAKQSPPGGGRSLKIELNGSGAVAYSPPIPVDSLSAYVLEGYIRTTGLKHDHAFYSLTFLDRDRQKLRVCESEKVVATNGWQRLRLGPITLDDKPKYVILGLHLGPRGDVEDLTGSASFGDLWLGRLPRVALKAKAENAASPELAAAHWFTDPQDIQIRCSISGLDAKKSQIVFTLQDAFGKELARDTQAISAKRSDSTSSTATPDQNSEDPIEAVWKPSVPGQGYYRVQAIVSKVAETDDSRSTQKAAEWMPIGQADLTMVVIKSHQAATGSEFGWELPRDNRLISLSQFGELLGETGVRWVKYPLQSDAGKGPPIDPLITFTDRINQQGMELVARLYVPEGKEPVPAVESFSRDPKTWYPSIEAVQARLGTQIRWWQIGDDRDTYWTSCSDLGTRVARVKSELDRIGQDVHVGVAWDWQQPLPPLDASKKTTKTAWQFLMLVSNDSTTARELGDQLAALQVPGVDRWLVLNALPSEGHSTEDRVSNLVKRIIAAKVSGVEGIFCANPQDAQHGLIHDDGTPTELLVPWRTTALALGGAQYVGSLDLPRGTPNAVFIRQGELTMAVWNDRPIEDMADLGEKIQQLDLWGGSTPCGKTSTDSSNAAASESIGTTIRADRLPTFLTGLNEPVVRWQLDATLARETLPSIAFERQGNSLRLKNSFPKAVKGRATIVAPADWRVEPRTIEFHLAPGESWQQPLNIVLPLNVIAGRHQVPIDFEIEADRVYHVRAWRRIEIGMGEVLIKMTSRLDNNGELEIEQTLTNRGKKPVSFRCSVSAPGRRLQTANVFGLATGSDQKLYRLPDGEDLVGKTLWLRAEEVNGPRMFNYPFVIEDAKSADR